MRRGVWTRIKRQINVHGMVPYEGRHTYLSAMENEGMNGTTIQSAAGHAKLSTTQNNYIHVDNKYALNEGAKMALRYDRMPKFVADSEEQPCHGTPET